MLYDLKYTTNTHVTPKLQGIIDNFNKNYLNSFLLLHFYPSTTCFTHPNDGWMGVCIKLCCPGGRGWLVGGQFPAVFVSNIYVCTFIMSQM